MSSPAFVTSGGHLALDLVNTRPLGPDGQVDERLARVADLDAWLTTFGPELPRPRRLSRDLLDEVHTLRDAVAAVVDATLQDTPVPQAPLDVLTDLQRRAPAYRVLSVVDGAVHAEVTRTGDRGDALLATLADAATDLLAGEGQDRVRRCEAPDCIITFLATNPRRRWCSTATCGNRVRVARHYRRHHG